jgi:hypothetical protein
MASTPRMYKTILLFFWAIAATLCVQAQTTPFEQFEARENAFGYGIKGGVNFSMPNVNEWTDRTVNMGGVNTRVGLQFGIIGMMPLNRYWVFRPELNYSSQGFTFTKLESGMYSERLVEQNYVQLPLMLQWTVWRNVGFYFGPKAGYMVGRSEGFKRGDLAWDIGISTLNIWNFGFDVRCSLGMLNIAPEDHPAFARAKNRAFQVGLVYLFTEKR